MVCFAERLAILIQDRNGLMLLEAETGEVLHTLDTQTEGGWLTGFSRKGDLIFSAGTSSEIRVLSNDLKSVVRTLTAPFDVVAYATISSDSSRLFAISPGGDYALWNIVNGDLQFHGSAVNRSVKTFSGTQDLRTIVNAEPFTNLFVKNIESESIETIMSRGERFDHLLFSPDQNWLLSVGRSQINGRSRASGWMTQWTSVLSEPLTTLHFLPQSDAYLVGRADGRIQTFLVECEPLDQTIAEGIADPRALSLSRDGSQIVVSGKGIAVYDTVSAKRVRIITADGLCVDSDWNSDALHVATSKQRDLLCVEDWSCGPVVGHRAEHSIRSVATGGEQVYLGLAFGEISQLVDGDSSKVETWNAHDSTVTALAYVTAKNMLLSGSDTGEVALWDQDRKLISRFQLHDGAVTEFAYVLSGERIYCSSRDGAIGVIDAKMLSALPPLRFGIGRLRTLAISPDGQSLAIASTGNDILICDAVTGEFQTRLNGHEDFVMDLCFSPSGDSLYSVSLDGTLRRWLPRSR
ncbi:MAG: WD40 repeat domain-containing protein [Aureliella sp.]